MSEPSVTVRVPVRDLLPARSAKEPWTWKDEERDILSRECLCCGKAGHYQQIVEAVIAERGIDPIYVQDGRVRDGHHRVVAAIRLGISHLTLETKTDAKARWIRDHGYVSWNDRKSGDRAAPYAAQRARKPR